MADQYPLLFVTNPGALRRDRKVNAGGSKKDFFADRDEALIAHKGKISNDIRMVQQQLSQTTSHFCKSAFVKVRLQERAWAKTHRPTRKLFTPDIAPVVGGGDIGELIVRVNKEALDSVAASVSGVEQVTRRKRDSRGKLVEDPSRERSEVGAIEQLTLWSSDDRRIPSAASAIESLRRYGLAAMYSVQLFESVATVLERGVVAQRRSTNVSPALSFIQSLNELSKRYGVFVLLNDEETTVPYVYVGLVENPGFAVLRGKESFAEMAEQLRTDAEFGRDAHTTLLSLLAVHPNVRRVNVPDVFVADRKLTFSPSSAPHRARLGATSVISYVPARIPAPLTGKNYPIVGVIDGGISKSLKSWVVQSYDLVAPKDRDLEHGTNIGGLLVGAESLNSGYAARFEADGCWLVDIAMYPDENKALAGSYYESGSAKFLDRLEGVVAACREQHDVRIFNFSLNNRRAVSNSEFSEEARRLDQISRRYDVIFVISAGNAEDGDARPEWDRRPSYAAAQLIESKNDSLHGPADSLLNISVGATNGHGVAGCIPDAPARYSRRGPGVRGSVKPDVCHIGGAAGDDDHTGLFSVTKGGMLTEVLGTSFAAPLAAKTLAAIDLELDGRAPREVLQAMFIHSAHLKPPMSGRGAKKFARNLVGFGFPAVSHQILSLDRHTFGVVVHDSIRPGENTVIDFKWPQALVGADGKCFGAARMTLVYSPPLDFTYGAEAARISLDASLRQASSGGSVEGDDDEDIEDEKISYIGRLKPVHSHGLKRTSREAALLLDGLKWSPVKVLEGQFNGIGSSSDWRLTVNYVTRELASFPDEGVPFAVVLTIEDPTRSVDVYDDLRQELLSGSALHLTDIRNALRARARTRG
ncbi:S8 family peptidase [Paraburkholderia sp. BCC1884]|uniref:S8 family peptidase n=1 Tax=Paraburkholderia sp. BCC1884 TaxID=2562668 RepID=UPI0011835E2F|nr:S8 family peptidase [Paraburkholderia sp. BCC1884]